MSSQEYRSLRKLPAAHYRVANDEDEGLRNVLTCSNSISNELIASRETLPLIKPLMSRVMLFDKAFHALQIAPERYQKLGGTAKLFWQILDSPQKYMVKCRELLV